MWRMTASAAFAAQIAVHAILEQLVRDAFKAMGLIVGLMLVARMTVSMVA